MSETEAVVFDLGGVVLGSPLEGIEEYEKKHNVPLGFVNVSIVSKGRDGAFQRLERGELGMAEFYSTFKQELGQPENVLLYARYLKKKGRQVPENLPKAIDIDTVELFRMMMDKAAVISKDMCHALFVLRGLGYKVAALTNNWQLDEKDSKSAKDSSSTNLLQAFFDEIIESSVVGLRKPDPRLYELACKILKVEPTKVAFLDDIGLNLKAAKEFGWKTVRVEIGKQKEALRKLAGILGLEPTVLVPEPQYVQERPTTLSFKAGIDGGKIALDMFGYATDPIVMFLHGGGQTRHAWAKSASFFASKGFCALTVDMKGHGDSYWDERPDADYHEKYGFRSVAKDLDRLVRHLKLHLHHHGYALVGASFGGLASLTSSFAKENAKALVLVDITPKMRLDGVSRITSWMKSTAKSGFASLEDAAQAVQAYHGGHSGGSQAGKSLQQTAAQSQGLLKNLRKRDDGRYVWHWDPEFIPEADANEEKLEKIAAALLEDARATPIPTMLLRGMQTDIVSLEDAKALLDNLPNGTFVDIKDASHMIVGDQNEAFSSECFKFLSANLVEQPSPISKL